MPPAKDPRIAAYLAKNKEWAESPSYKTPITFEEMQKKGREKEDGTVIVIACTDPRVTPEDFLGMSSGAGNKATIIRTAGGRVHSILSTLLVLSAVGNGGKKGTIMVIHHTDCGLATATDEQLRRILMQNRDLPPPPRAEVKEKEVGDIGKEKALRDLNGMKFGSISKGKEEASVREDVEFLRNCGWFNGMGIWGGLMDTATGVVREVISFAGEGGK